jgi:TM2 domain-containing membrane protein YozV
MAKQTKGVRKEKRNWITALLLSIFLGALGVDRFYMGYIGTGILKLLISIVTLGFASWIWWIIDLILIATKYDFKRVEWAD